MSSRWYEVEYLSGWKLRIKPSLGQLPGRRPDNPTVSDHRDVWPADPGAATAVGLAAPYVPAFRDGSWLQRLRHPLTPTMLAALGILGMHAAYMGTGPSPGG